MSFVTEVFDAMFMLLIFGRDRAVGRGDEK